ncbi:MAG TPA: glycosyltransferase family 4 protein [Acidimicrobiia bacterium]|jgi:glycosyltransferase involved in cell wall biosynthesis
MSAPSGLGRIVFANENLGGHTSMHRYLREVLPEVAPDIDAQFVDARPPNLGERIVSAAAPGLGRLDLDLQPLRSQLARSRAVRSALGRVGPFDVLHIHTQSIALQSVDLLRSHASLVSTDGTLAQVAFRIPYRRPTRFTAAALPVAQMFERRVYEAATLLLAKSQWAAGAMQSAYGVSPDRIRIVPFGVPPGPEPVHRDVPVPEITFIGVTLERKGGQRLLRVFREQFRDRCVLNLVTREAVPAEPGVRVIGDFEPADPRLPELLSRSAMFVFPTEIDYSPIAVLEAMRAGLPVITTRSGAVPEMVDDGVTGILVAHDDADLARAISTLLDDPDRARSMGVAGRARLEERFDARKTTAGILDVCAEASELHSARSYARHVSFSGNGRASHGE